MVAAMVLLSSKAATVKFTVDQCAALRQQGVDATQFGCPPLKKRTKKK